MDEPPHQPNFGAAVQEQPLAFTGNMSGGEPQQQLPVSGFFTKARIIRWCASTHTPQVRCLI
jgi:hypothetical protein